jgi:guanylate kinase
MTSTPSPGRLTVITGPSGVGKGTLVSRLLERHPGIWLSVSATTRAPRPGEQEGIQYFFLERPDFEQLAAGGGLLEWAEFAGNLYGTPREPVETELAPAKTPPEIVARLYKESAALLQDRATLDKMDANDFVPTVMNPEQFGAYIRSEIEKWGKVVKATGARAD